MLITSEGCFQKLFEDIFTAQNSRYCTYISMYLCNYKELQLKRLQSDPSFLISTEWLF